MFMVLVTQTLKVPRRKRVPNHTKYIPPQFLSFLDFPEKQQHLVIPLRSSLELNFGTSVEGGARVAEALAHAYGLGLRV